MPLDKRAQKEVYVRLGQRIRQRREELGMSQEELGSRIGLSVASVQACEDGRKAVRITLIEALSNALAISPSSLLHDEEVGKFS